MVESFIALASILVGILGANTFGFIWKPYSLGTIADTITGVFGSILFIKSLGRLGFDPNAIMQTGSLDLALLMLNFIVSFLGGAVSVWIAFRLNKYFNQ